MEHRRQQHDFIRNPAALTAAVMVLLAAGFGAGLVVGERRPVEERRPGSGIAEKARANDPNAKPNPAGKVADLETADENVQLRERVRVLETELQTHRDNPASTLAKRGSDALAEQMFDDFLAMETDSQNDPERLRAMFAGLGQLDPATAKIFIDRYRKIAAEGGKPYEKLAAIQLALASGGPDAAQFLKSLLQDQTLDPATRSQVLSQIGPIGISLFSIRRLPVDDSLGSTAMALIRSNDDEERRAGAGLLGGVATPASRLELERMLIQDSDVLVRIIAVRSLAVVGDSSSRRLLEPLAADGKEPALQRAAATALRQLDRTSK